MRKIWFHHRDSKRNSASTTNTVHNCRLRLPTVQDKTICSRKTTDIKLHLICPGQTGHVRTSFFLHPNTRKFINFSRTFYFLCLLSALAIRRLPLAPLIFSFALSVKYVFTLWEKHEHNRGTKKLFLWHTKKSSFKYLRCEILSGMQRKRSTK